MKQRLLSLLAALMCLTGTNAWALDGSGTSVDPYQIATADDWEDFAALVNAADKSGLGLCAILTADITLTDPTMCGYAGGNTGYASTTEYNSNAAVYTGTFDGKGHTITVTKNVTQTLWALFAGLGSGGVIQNLNLEGTYTTTATMCAALVNTIREGAVVQYCRCAVEIKNQSLNGGFSRCCYGTIQNCVFAGSLTGDKSNGFGFTSASAVIKNCLLLSFGPQTSCSNSRFFFRGTTPGTFEGNYYLSSITGSVHANAKQGTAVTEDELKTGELCYMLNDGNTTDPVFRQTIGTADITFGLTGDIVYRVGNYQCDGVTPKEGTVAEYTNTEGASNIDAHTFADGFCTVCGTLAPDYMTADEEGFFEIGTTVQFVWFTAYVNAGNTSANARLTANITVDDPDMIGKCTWEWTSKYVNGGYEGIFDGQFHTLTITKTVSTEGWGLFARQAGGTIRNLHLAGTITANARCVAPLVNTQSGGTISNCHVSVDIVSNAGGIHCGIARIMDGEESAIISCVYSGTITGTATANCGGISYCYLSTNRIENCAVTSSFGPTDSGSYIIARGAGNAQRDETCLNCYYLNTKGASVGVNTGATEITSEQIASGLLCYKLNGGETADAAWRQTIGTDSHPVLGGSSVPVYYVGTAGYATLYDTATGYTLGGDVKAYVATFNAKKTWLDLTEAPGIPAGTPVVLKGSYYNRVAADVEDAALANDLKGTDSPTEANGSMYILAKPETGDVGFYLATGTIPAGKAYIETASDVKAFHFGSGDATGIGMVNGQSKMVNEAPVYNLAGQRLSKLQSGINIVGGKKILK